MCTHHFNQKFCLVVLGGFVFISYTTIEVTGLLSGGTAEALESHLQDSLLSSPVMESYLKAFPKWRYVSQRTVSGPPLLLSASGNVTGTDI